MQIHISISKISTPISNFARFLTKTERVINQYISTLKSMEDLYKKGKDHYEDFEYYLESWFYETDGGDRYLATSIEDIASSWHSFNEPNKPNWRLAGVLSAIDLLKHADQYPADLISKSLEHFQEDLKEILGTIAQQIEHKPGYDQSKFRKLMRDATEKTDNPDRAALLEAGHVYQQIQAGLSNLYVIIRSIETMTAQVTEHRKYWKEIRESTDTWTGKQGRPQAEDVETLYHATLFATYLVKEGFSSKTPEDRMGLGSFGRIKNLISFTHNLRYARTIERTFKELWGIANGKIKEETLLKKVRRDLNGAAYDSTMQEYNSYKDGERVTAIQALLHLYRAWLSLKSQKARENVMLVNIMDLEEPLRSIRLRDIGVIEADVNMTDPDIEYLSAEHEYRVPPTAVIGKPRLVRG